MIDILNEQKQQELLEQIENGRKAKIALGFINDYLLQERATTIKQLETSIFQTQQEIDINADYPAVPNTILISGNFNFDEGTERKFNIEPCDTYVVNVIVQKGRVVMYPGNSAVCVEIAENTEVPYHYKATLDWEYSPFLRLIGKENGTVVTVHAELDRDYLVNAKVGGRTWQ